MTQLSDVVVVAILAGPYVLVVGLLVAMEVMHKRVKRLERKNDLESIQWRER